MTNKIVALLPMKANSDRVQGKNFRPFVGKPLFAWILDTLLSLPEISEVVINTDARAILAENGLVDRVRVRIRDRKPEICGDFVSMNLVLADDVANVPADVYVMTHTTNPLLKRETVRAAISAYEGALAAGSHDSLFSVQKHQTRFYRSNGEAINHDPNNLIRTQDLEAWYEENSNLYLFTGESFTLTNSRIGRTPILFEMGRNEGIDIDDQESWNLAEALALRRLAAAPALANT